MDLRPILLDLFCCQGGSSAGYARAGFRVVGVDKDPQPRYPFEFHQGDALKFLLENHRKFDAVSASPPCQTHTNAQKIQGNEHPDFIHATRELLNLITNFRSTGNGRPFPWVIENVPGAPLIDHLTLCGRMFGLETYRHRVFELGGFQVKQPDHLEHVARTTKMGRPPQDGEYMHIVGNFSGVSRAREVMGMSWASRDGLREAIPPAYTEYIGRQMIEHVNYPTGWKWRKRELEAVS